MNGPSFQCSDNTDTRISVHLHSILKCGFRQVIYFSLPRCYPESKVSVKTPCFFVSHSRFPITSWSLLRLRTDGLVHRGPPQSQQCSDSQRGFLSVLICIAQELCESRGGRPGMSVLTSLMVSVDVKQHWTMLRHWSQLVPNMSTDIRGH